MDNLVKSNYFDPRYNGTDNYYKHPLFRFNYTDSIKDFCEEHKAYWTLDVIGSYMRHMNKYPFLIAIFDVMGQKCIFQVKEDSNRPSIITQEIEYTDLDVSIKLYYENNVLCFPSDR